TVQETDSTSKDPDDALNELIREYNDLRATLKSGATRTTGMTRVWTEMLKVAPDASQFETASALESLDNGRRLAAYARLYADPNPPLIGRLVDAVVNEDKP